MRPVVLRRVVVDGRGHLVFVCDNLWHRSRAQPWGATMPDLPSGTVTFLFTDIEVRPALWEQDRAGMRVAVARQLATVQGLIAAHHGVLDTPIGDGTQAAFASSEVALRASVPA